MVQTMTAVFDGTAFRPEGRVDLKPNTRVRIVVETPSLADEAPASFLDTARSLNLEGPADWSERFHVTTIKTPQRAGRPRVPEVFACLMKP